MTGTEVARPLCGAKKRQGPGNCRRPAGWGTDHAGVGRCKLHGGSNPVKHGRYSTVTRTKLATLIAEYEADPDPLNALPELATMRALLKDWLDRQGDSPDPTEALPLLEGLSRAVKRVRDSENAQAISRGDFLRVMTEMGRVVDLVVDDEDLRQRIRDGWMGIRLA